jgi:nucleotide-binding universal stress UspA family protein
MYKKILVPLDGSLLAETVLPHAKALAKSEGAELILLHVTVAPPQYLFAQNPVEGENIVKMIVKEAVDYMEAEVSILQTEGVKVIGIMRDGLVPDMILNIAEETHADMIAMSTHGHSGSQDLLMGNVADYVLRYSHIPVMLLHPNFVYIPD